MNTTYNTNPAETVRFNLASIPAFFKTLAASLAARVRPTDDPAALRYIASKYPGEID